MKQFIAKNQDFFGPIFAIALPLALQNLISASLNMIDVILIGQMGQTAIAAVGLANQVFFLLNLFLFGINSGASIFFAQFWGQRDITNIRRVQGAGLISGIIISFLFALVAFFIPGPVLYLFSNDREVVAQGSAFLRVIAPSYIITAISFSFAFVLRSTGQVRLPVKISAVALGANTLLNYLLIYGKFGFPRLGVPGSALATLIARSLELALFLFIVYRKRLVPAAGLKELTDLAPAFIRRFFKTTLPVILNESLWAFGVTMFTVVYAHMGTAVVAGVNIFATIERLAFVLFFGLAQACAVTVGHDIGAGQEEKAFNRSKQYSMAGPLFSLLIGWSLVLASPLILSFFKISIEAAEIVRRILLIFAFVIPFKVFNLINIVGILRSGGDTRFSLILDTGILWLAAVPLAFIGGLVWKLPPPMVYLLSATEEVFKFILGVNRLLSRKWIHNLTHSMRTAAKK
jgi:putative MATE family efflux protein